MEDFPQFAIELELELGLWKRELQGEAHSLLIFFFFCEDKR